MLWWFLIQQFLQNRHGIPSRRAKRVERGECLETPVGRGANVDLDERLLGKEGTQASSRWFFSGNRFAKPSDELRQCVCPEMPQGIRGLQASLNRFAFKTSQPKAQ